MVQEILLPAMQEALIAAQSLPAYAHLCVVTVQEMMLPAMQEALIAAQSLLLPVMQEALNAVQSLPAYVHLCIVTTLERLLVLLSLVLNAYVCILFVKTWKFPQKEKKVDEERILTIEKFIGRHSKVC